MSFRSPYNVHTLLESELLTRPEYMEVLICSNAISWGSL